MDYKLYYEKKNVSTVAEVKETFDYAVAGNYKFYRAVTEKGIYFGWLDGKHQKAAAGQEWFINPEYKEEPTQETLLADKTADKLLNKKATTENESVVALADTPNTKETLEKFDYKALYDEKVFELEQYKADYEKVCGELSLIKTAIFTIAKEWKEADNKLKE